MPWGVAAAAVGGIASAATGSLLGGGGTGGSSSTNAYVPYNQYAQDQNFNNYYGQYGNTLYDYYNTVNPLASATMQGQYYNPQTSNYLGSSQIAQNAYNVAGNNATGAGGTDYGLGQQLAAASGNWGLNGAELGLLQNQASDTANSQSYLRGIQNTPYGASVATNAVDNTNLNYALNQASTQASLANAATSAYGAATNQYGAAGQYYGTGASIPYNAQNTVYGNQNSALTNYYGSTVSPFLSGLNQLQGNALQYLGYGNTANNTAQNAAAQQQQLYSGLVSGGASLGNQVYNAFSSPSGNSNYGFSTGNSVYSNPSTYDYYGLSGYGGYGLGY